MRPQLSWSVPGIWHPRVLGGQQLFLIVWIYAMITAEVILNYVATHLSIGVDDNATSNHFSSLSNHQCWAQRLEMIPRHSAWRQHKEMRVSMAFWLISALWCVGPIFGDRNSWRNWKYVAYVRKRRHFENDSKIGEGSHLFRQLFDLTKLHSTLSCT